MHDHLLLVGLHCEAEHHIKGHVVEHTGSLGGLQEGREKGERGRIERKRKRGEGARTTFKKPSSQ